MVGSKQYYEHGPDRSCLSHRAYRRPQVEKPLPKLLHARIQSFLIRILASMLSKRIEVLSELNVVCGKNHEDRLVPDVTVVPRDANTRTANCSTLRSYASRFSLLVRRLPTCWIEPSVCLKEEHQSAGSSGPNGGRRGSTARTSCVKQRNL